jgi:hypothetical protein
MAGLDPRLSGQFWHIEAQLARIFVASPRRIEQAAKWPSVHEIGAYQRSEHQQAAMHPVH